MIRIPGPIPITFHPFFWIVILGIGWINSGSAIGMAIWASVILVSIVIHELGHALTAVAFGQRARIDLIGFGGLTTRGGKQLSLWKEFLIVANGPLAGFALAGLAYPFYLKLNTEALDLAGYIIVITLWVNLFWTAVNLLPIVPLDGGRLLGIVLEGAFGVVGLKIALAISLAISAMAAIVAFYFNFLLVGAFFFLFAFESYREWSASRRTTPTDRNHRLRELFDAAKKDVARGNHKAAKEKFQRICSETQNGLLHDGSVLILAELLALEGAEQQAYDLVRDIDRNEESIPLIHRLAWKVGDLSTVLSVANLAYQYQPQYETAVINAFAYADNKESAPAIGWLQRAIADGLPNSQQIIESHHFDPVRKDPAFPA